MIADLVAKNRSYRRFKQTPAVTRKDLESFVDVARVTSSGGNLQPLAYYLSSEAPTNALIFATLKWAGYIRDWEGPGENERPTAYLVLLRDNDITTNYMIDHGIAGETIRLAAIEKGFGSCILGSIDRKKLRADLGIAAKFEILVVIALGTPGEQVVMEPVTDGDIKYHRDAAGVMHVPKRALKDILVN